MNAGNTNCEGDADSDDEGVPHDDADWEDRQIDNNDEDICLGDKNHD